MANPIATRRWSIPDDPLGAFCRHNHAELQGSDGGPLAGLSFAVKDCFHIAGAATGFGQPDWLASHPVPEQTAEIVLRLADAGADMVGKTHCDELCYSLTGENVHYGTPVNVNAKGRIPGGSSNGSAAAVAGGLVDFALGSDCGGSVRLPASYCGILGIRPTHGRVSLDGAIAFGPSFDVAGWLARDARVLERVGAVLLGADPINAAPRRLRVVTDAFARVEPRVRDALAPAIQRIQAMLAERDDIDVSGGRLDDWFETFKTIQAGEVWANHGAWITRTKPRLGPGVKERLAWAATVSDDAIAAARKRRAAIVEQLDAALEPGDVLCLPTSPRVAPPTNTPADQIEVEYREQAMRILCISGLNGLPQISLPLATLDGLPLGLSLSGPRGSDLALLGLARALGAEMQPVAPSGEPRS